VIAIRKAVLKVGNVFPQNTYSRGETALENIRDQTPAESDVGI